MKTTFLTIGFALFSLLLPIWVLAQTNVNSNITTDTTWDITDSPVTVEQTITISAGATLTISPGVTVRMGANASILVDGALVADGTPTDRILFTSSMASPAAGDWGSIEFLSNTDNGSVIDYVTMEYGAGADRSGMIFYKTGAFGVNLTNSVFRNSAVHGVNLRASSPVISNSEFYDNNGYGIYTDNSLSYTVEQSSVTNNVIGGIRVPINSAATITESVIENNGLGILIDNGALPTITNNQITQNQTGIRVIEVGATKPTITDNTISGNTDWGIENLGNLELVAKFNFWGSSLGPEVATNPTGNGDKITLGNVDYTPWRYGATDLPVVEIDANILSNTTWASDTVYLLKNSITVSNGAALTVQPGAVVKFAPNVSLRVDGTIVAEGTSDKLIFFTSEKDDAAGGDSNGDGDASLPGHGDWGQITINGNGSSFSNGVIRYGAGSSGVLDISVPVSLSDLNVSNNSRSGIVSRASQSGWTSIRSVDNTFYGIYVERQSIELSDSETSFNGFDGLFVQNASTPQSIQLTGFTSTYNDRYGVYVDGNNTYNQTQFEWMTNSVISFNGEEGVRIVYSPAPIAFNGNTLESNGTHGISLNHGGSRANVSFENNVLQNNGESGILSSQARFIDNTFEGNRFSIGSWESLGHRYTDDLGVDGNTFTANTYNNALALYASNIRDTLSATFPQAIDSRTYLLVTTGNGNSAEHELLIEPGVTVKSSGEEFSNGRLSLLGKLTAVGTEADPIVFTSLRDHDYGGNVNVASDTLSAAPGDWFGLSLLHTGTIDSRLQHVRFRYGRYNLELANNGSNGSVQTVEYTHPIEDVWVDNALNDGIRVEEGAVTFNRLKVTDNGFSGIYLNERSGNDFVTRAIVRNAEVTGNGSYTGYQAGLYANSSASYDGAAFTEISNSVISQNTNGVMMNLSSIPVTVLGTELSDNEQHGIQLNSQLKREDVAFVGNIIQNNGESGILSSQARFIDNTFEGNRFSIGSWESLGHRYTDDLGVDGNTFTANTYNNALALYATGLRDTLSATFPQAIDSRTYLLVTTGNANSADHELLIEPGVTVKSSGEEFSNGRLSLQGKLTAVGTEADPIVFTSLRDHDYGGNVNVASDTLSAAPGDWFGLSLLHTGTVDSRLQHVRFRYGRYNLELANNGSNGSVQTVEYTHPIEDVWVDNALNDGIRIEEGAVTFNRLKVTDNGFSGIYLNERSGNDFVTRAIVRNAEVTGNGSYTGYQAGLYANSSASYDGAAFTEISNSVISQNTNGVMMIRGTLPSSIQFSEFSQNARDGFFADMIEVQTDTVLAFTGNTFSQNERVGMMSSRALVKDNHYEANQIPIAVMGELSKPGTVNEFGNEYEGNTFGEHTLQDAIGVYSTGSRPVTGNLGFTLPSGFTRPAHIFLENISYFTDQGPVTIAPGTVFKAGLNSTTAKLVISGQVNAEGTVDDKIVFTSIFDDTYSGDTNRDGIDTMPDRRNWTGIEVDGESSSLTRFKHVIARYGNNNFTFKAGTEAVIDSSYSSNAFTGISIQSQAKPTIRNSEIHSNRYGISVTSNSDDPNMHLNNIYGNDDAGLSASRNVTAENNYWGDATGPFVDQGSDLNMDGQGNRIIISGSSEVDYRPFLTDRTGILLGDVSEDGTISGYDGAITLQDVVDLITLSSTQLAAADVSGDGSVTAMDASYIMQYVVGSISGFPGAGKIPAVNPDELFEINTESGDGYYDVIVNTLGTLPLYAGELRMDYNEALYSTVELIGTSQTTGWITQLNTTDGVVKAAVAGTEPAVEEGSLIHLRFTFNENNKAGSIGQMNVQSLVLNEMNFDESATEILTDIDDTIALPEVYKLGQNYPNPFNPSTMISYQLPVRGEVSVSIYNSVGRQVATLVNGEQQAAGAYSYRWNAGSLASGIYFYRINITGENGQNFTDVKKMMLIK